MTETHSFKSLKPLKFSLSGIPLRRSDTTSLALEGCMTQAYVNGRVYAHRRVIATGSLSFRFPILCHLTWILELKNPRDIRSGETLSSPHWSRLGRALGA